MAARSGYCGIDVGTSGVRAVVIDDSGAVLGEGAAPLATSSRNGVRHEQHPADWWAALGRAVRTAVAEAGDDVTVQAVALDATSGTVLVEAADGTARGPALMYDDARAAGQAERAQRVGAELWSALGYRMQPVWALPKVMWLAEFGALGPGDGVVHQADHLARRLTGARVATDTSTALKTGADLRDATWPEAVFGELGVPVDRLPELVWPGTVIGAVSVDGTEATGLPAGTPLRAGMTDGCAAQIAAGALRPGRWSSALGTTLVLKGSTEQLVRDPQGAVYSHRHPDGGWLPGGASSTGAGAIAAAFGPGTDLDRLTALAAARPAVAGATYPLAGRGERFPFVAPDAEGFLAPTASTDPERFAALCQGVAYVERLAYDVLRRLGADTSGTVSLTGGASVNEWWNQLRTDVLGRPTVRPASAQAATGMAVLAAAEPGALTDTAERLVRLNEQREPDPERGAALAEGYAALVTELADRGWLNPSVAADVLDPALAR